MSRSSNLLVVAASLAGVIAAGTLAMAQSSSPETQPSAAEARLAWAKRHVELVCRPLEAQRLFDKATRCYNDVARLMESSRRETTAANSEQPQPAVTASPTPANPAAEASPAPAASAPARPKPAVRPAPVRTAAAKPASRIAPVRAPARITVAQADRPAVPALTQSGSGRCSGMSCLRYTLLGVGF